MIGGDGLARGAAATLEAQLPAAITAINAEAGAPVQLTTPSDYVVYGDRVLPDLAVVGVAVEVSCADQQGRDLDVDTLQADATGMVQVTVWVQDVVWADLVEKLNRYARAVLAVLVHRDTITAGGTVTEYAARVRAADVDPEAADAQAPQGWASVALKVEYTEVLSV